MRSSSMPHFSCTSWWSQHTDSSRFAGRLCSTTWGHALLQPRLCNQEYSWGTDMGHRTDSQTSTAVLSCIVRAGHGTLQGRPKLAPSTSVAMGRMLATPVVPVARVHRPACERASSVECTRWRSREARTLESGRPVRRGSIRAKCPDKHH